MKRFFVLQLIIFFALKVFSQDIITLQNGDTITAKVTKISEQEIEYKKWSNISGPTYTLNIDKIGSIKYVNGETDVFNHVAEISSAVQYEKLNYRKFNKVYINDKQLTDEEVEDLLKNRCPDAFNMYKSGMKKRSMASTFGFVGALSWGVSLLFYLNSNENLVPIGYIFDIAGTGLIVASIPIGSVGKHEITDSYDYYNDYVSKKNKGNSLSLNFGACQSGGIGLSLNF